MIRVIKESAEHNGNEYLNKLIDKYVPANGTADTKLGELLRCYNQIIYRFNNDGDQVGLGYGNETCNPPLRCLLAFGVPIDENFADILDNNNPGFDDRDYSRILTHFAEDLEKYVKANFEKLATTENTEDMWDYTEYTDSNWEEEEEEEDDDYWDHEEDDYPW